MSGGIQELHFKVADFICLLHILMTLLTFLYCGEFVKTLMLKEKVSTQSTQSNEHRRKCLDNLKYLVTRFKLKLHFIWSNKAPFILLELSNRYKNVHTQCSFSKK